jgi:hypothetical protein
VTKEKRQPEEMAPGLTIERKLLSAFGFTAMDRQIKWQRGAITSFITEILHVLQVECSTAKDSHWQTIYFPHMLHQNSSYFLANISFIHAIR